MKFLVDTLEWFIFFATVLALATPYISPEIFWWIAPLGILFPYLYLALVVIFILQLFLNIKRSMLSGLLLLLGIPTASKYITYSKNIPLRSIRNNQTLTLTSFNSMLFDLYNWFHNHETRPKILNSLHALHPDVLCLQEFYTSEEPGDFNNIDSIRKLLNLQQYHAEFTTTLRNTDHWGIATFCRFPVVRMGKFDFHVKSNNLCIYSDILFHGDTVRIYNFHLQSYGLSAYLDSENRIHQRINWISKIKNWYLRIRNGYLERAAQADAVATHMASCPYPFIACGDLNDVPCSYAYHKLRGNLNDAFLTEGFGLGRTYSGKGPRFRIDYIFYSDHWNCLEYQKAKQTFTDHFPISAVLEIKKRHNFQNR